MILSKLSSVLAAKSLVTAVTSLEDTFIDSYLNGVNWHQCRSVVHEGLLSKVTGRWLP